MLHPLIEDYLVFACWIAAGVDQSIMSVLTLCYDPGNFTAPAPYMYLKITVSINGNELKHYHFEPSEVLIGRDVDCHVRLDNVGVSRHHAKLLYQGEAVQVVDLGSGNGTFVNGVQVEQAFITTGDTVRIGKFILAATLTPYSGPANDEQSVESGATDTQVDSKTVFLRPHETQKLLQQTPFAGKSPVTAIHSPPGAEKKQSSGFILVAGALLGLFMGWLFWY